MNKIVAPGTTGLFLAPHPDDAEYYAGGTLARMAKEGARITIAIATDGRRGSFHLDSPTLAALRAEEARQAAKVLGAEPPIMLGHPDMELDQLKPGALREQFIRLIRQHRPDIVVVEDATAIDEVHPDHRAVAWAASDALNYATLPLVHPEHLAEGLQTHFVREKYFYGNTRDSGKIVDVTETLSVKLAALAEHKTQMQFLVEDVLIQARLAGLPVDTMMPGVDDNPMLAMTWAMQAEAAQVGAKAGVQFGEAFRYQRFHPFIESLLNG